MNKFSLPAGVVEAIADNPDDAKIIELISSLEEPSRNISVEHKVMRAIRRERLVRRLFVAVPSVAAVVAFVVAMSISLSDAGNAMQSLSDGGNVTLSVATLPPEIVELIASQQSDGSWIPRQGGESLAPAGTALALMKLSAHINSETLPVIERGIEWLRANQNDDGSFGDHSKSFNISLPAIAMLNLYGSGCFPELFTPIDRSVNAARRSLDVARNTFTNDDLCLAGVLALADSYGWSDSLCGNLRRSLMRIADSGNSQFDPINSAVGFSAKCDMILSLATKVYIEA